MSTISTVRFFLAAGLVLCSVACSSGKTSSDKTDAGTSDAAPDVPGTAGFLGSGGEGGFGGAGTASSGGIPNTGGTTSSSGKPATGGTTATGGGASLGGMSATGGTTVTGGLTASGGTSATGGIIITGGASGSGGTTNTGGSVTGGITRSGGVGGSGGISVTGGATLSGGTSATGGISAAGGVTPSGGTGGMAGSGGSTGSGGTTGSSGEYGFTYRSPGSHNESCADPQSGYIHTIVAPDTDWLCTFSQSTPKGYVYVRLTSSGSLCSGMYMAPDYKVELAQISVKGVVTSLANAQYNFGGAHNDDYLTFDYQGATYKYFHSSLGYGYRKCQPMDCINIYELDSTTLKTEGCTSARTLPEVCVQIKAGGTHDPLVDTFAKCPGDPNK